MKAVVATLIGIVSFAIVLSIAYSYAHRPVSTATGVGEKRELLIYCGITMIKPMSEIARIVEEEQGCRILITKGGSGNMLQAIEVNGVGDLFLPGSESYIKTCQARGLVKDTVLVGYNKAALMVQKDNPKHISASLDNLANPKYYVVIGDPNSGSIGRETEKILINRGLFERVARNARQLTTDSKDLMKVLKDKEADLVVNWYATSTWPENAPYVESMSIPEEYASKKRLVLGLLTTSQHPEIARAFMQTAASPRGREIFRRYGLYDVK